MPLTVTSIGPGRLSRRWAHRKEEKVLNQFVNKIRKEMGLSNEVPEFDPDNGNENAKILFILEAPGRKATNTGLISLSNPDQTARNFKNQLDEAGIRKQDIAIWNIVPWYLGNGNNIRAAEAGDVNMGLKYLGDLIQILTKLKYIVLVGAAARRAHVYLSYTTDIKILGCHHPSPRVVNNYPEKVAENVAVFKKIK